MGKYLRKNKKYFGLVLIAVIAFNFIFPTLTAMAVSDAQSAALNKTLGAGPGWISGQVILFISSSISAIFGSIFGLFISLEAKIIDYVLSPSSFPLTKSTIVQIGWKATRDIANMFFILILLIIAFATVLKIQSYAIKQLWWKVLIAALLINFSLVIAGIVVDFTQVLTSFFLSKITGGGVGTISSRLASSMQILNFYNPAPPGQNGVEDLATYGAVGMAAFFGIILTLIGLTVTAFTFGAAILFLIVRILNIWFLLIFAPIVWMLWIMPATSKYFSQWWDNFIRWTFFAPVYTFMLYLSLSIFDVNGKLNTGVLPQGKAEWVKSSPGLTTASLPSAIFQWILVIALMFFSLIVAQKFGVEGAVGARKMLTGWGANAKNFAGRTLRRKVLDVGAAPAAEGKAATPGLLIRGAQKLAGTAIPGRRLIAGQVFKMAAGEAGLAESAKSQYTDWTSQARLNLLNNPPGKLSDALFRDQYMGAALAEKEKGDLGKLDIGKIREIAKMASKQYPKQLDEILKVAPHLAPEFDKNIGAIVGKIDKPEDMAMSSLEDEQVVINLNPTQFKTIAQKAKEPKKEQIQKTIEKFYQSYTKQFPELEKDIKEIMEENNKEKRNKKLGALTTKNEAGGKLARAKFSTSTPAWDL